jgi:hypothetical protein
MRNLEARLRRLEQKQATRARRSVFGITKGDVDRQVAALRQGGFKGEIDIELFQIVLVSAPPRDENFNIIGPAPAPRLLEDSDLDPEQPREKGLSPPDPRRIFSD